MIVRTAVMDEIVRRCVRAGAKTVLQPRGRARRPALPAGPATHLRWIHADMPPMVDYFRERMAGETPHCELEYAALDLRDEGKRRALFADAATRGPVLAITEGLLIYLPSRRGAARAGTARACARALVADRPGLAEAAEDAREALGAGRPAGQRALRDSGRPKAAPGSLPMAGTSWSGVRASANPSGSIVPCAPARGSGS
jgi:hypothetical protein